MMEPIEMQDLIEALEMEPIEIQDLIEVLEMKQIEAFTNLSKALEMESDEPIEIQDLIEVLETEQIEAFVNLSKASEDLIEALEMEQIEIQNLIEVLEKLIRVCFNQKPKHTPLTELAKDEFLNTLMDTRASLVELSEALHLSQENPKKAGV